MIANISNNTTTGAVAPVVVNQDDFNSVFLPLADQVYDLYTEAIHKAGRLYVETVNRLDNERRLQLEVLLAMQSRAKEGA